MGRLVAVMLMDLDGFKEINDTMGHHVGDCVLREVATRLMDSISEHGIVARLGGDEFGFVLPDLPERGARRRSGPGRAGRSSTHPGHRRRDGARAAEPASG